METARFIQAPDYFEIRLNSIAPGVPLEFDIYLSIHGTAIPFRKRGDVLQKQRLQLLELQGREQLLVPLEQRKTYLQSLHQSLHNADLDSETRGLLLKESAYLQVHDLFTKNDLIPVVQEAKNIVEEMVLLVTTDMETMRSLMHLSAHDSYTYCHCVNVAVYSIVLARKIFGDDKRILLLAGLGGLLHDIGKRKIATTLLNKTGSLTLDEWEEIKRHPIYGKDYLDELSFIPNEARLIVYEHHENYDGTGYPQNLRGEEISRLARIVTIADVFDALNSDRSYHRALKAEDALGTMYGMQPGKFDPQIFRSFNKNFSKRSSATLDPNFDPCSANPFLRKVHSK